MKIVPSLLVLGLLGVWYYLEKTQDDLNQKRLIHVLNLNEIPKGVSIVGTARDDRTDEVFFFVLRLDDGKIDEVLSGRKYTKTRVDPVPPHGGYNRNLPSFEVYHRYLPEENYRGLVIETDESENQAYVLRAAK